MRHMRVRQNQGSRSHRKASFDREQAANSGTSDVEREPPKNDNGPDGRPTHHDQPRFSRDQADHEQVQSGKFESA